MSRVSSRPDVAAAFAAGQRSHRTLVRDGNAMVSGTGVPPAGLAANGTFYFRTDTGSSPHIYKKIGGVWTVIV